MNKREQVIYDELIETLENCDCTNPAMCTGIYKNPEFMSTCQRCWVLHKHYKRITYDNRRQ